MGFDSLFTGISGLNAYQSEIDMISNNIANVGTYGFKGEQMTFADMFYQNQGFASAPTQSNGGIDPMQTGTGVKVNTIDTNWGQGGFESTGSVNDMAIQGDGFFILRNLDGSNDPVYTRDGHFATNSNGVLYDPATGMAVQGYMANASGAVTTGGVPGDLTIPTGLQMQATATGSNPNLKFGPAGDQNFDVGFGGALDQTQYAQQIASGTSTPVKLSTTIYDSLGNAHLATITFTPSPMAGAVSLNDTSGNTKTAATAWQYTVSFNDPKDKGLTTTSNSGYLYMDASGNFINTSSTNPPGATSRKIGAPPSAADGNALTISAWPTGDGAATPATIGLDFSGMQALALSGPSTATITGQNGFASGTLSNYTVDTDGTIRGSFTNGQKKVLGQIAMATFQNEGGLERTGGNAFRSTAASGIAQIGTPANGRFGSIIDGALEQSNVSLANEFTKMIVAQRAFEANTRGITTADQNLMTVMNLRASEN